MCILFTCVSFFIESPSLCMINYYRWITKVTAVLFPPWPISQNRTDGKTTEQVTMHDVLNMSCYKYLTKQYIVKSLIKTQYNLERICHHYKYNVLSLPGVIIS